MRIQNENLTLDGTDMQSSIVSDPVWLAHIVNFSVQAVYTGSPNGTLKLQGSNDQGAKDGLSSQVSISNWSDISGASESVTGAGNVLFNVENAGYRWFRLVWTDSASGSPSTLTSARFNVKGI